MSKEYYIEKFIELKNELNLSRDKAIKVYNVFKANPELNITDITIGGIQVPIIHEDLWDEINTSIIRDCFRKEKLQSEIEISDEEATNTDFSKLRKETISYKNKLSFERNNFNKKLKEICALEDLNKEIINSLKKLKPVSIEKHSINLEKQSEDMGVVVISDTHFNELINSTNNRYDFEIAGKRLKKLANSAKEYFIRNNINRVAILLLGDLLNSDRRMSEVFNMSTNRSHAMVLGFHLLRQFIADISSISNVVVASVAGNESRVVGEDFDTSDIMATYNYDYTIHEFLKVSFENIENVKFIDGDFGEKVVNINGSNVLLTHGTSYKDNLETSVQQTFGRYASNGINLDYLFCGHRHSARIGDYCARCGSLCGGNSYSEGALNLNSRASQLIGIFHKDKTNSIMRVDLQNTTGVKGYSIVKELADYNIKSENKRKNFIVHTLCEE